MCHSIGIKKDPLLNGIGIDWLKECDSFKCCYHSFLSHSYEAVVFLISCFRCDLIFYE